MDYKEEFSKKCMLILSSIPLTTVKRITSPLALILNILFDSTLPRISAINIHSISSVVMLVPLTITTSRSMVFQMN